ncbi:NAD(P)/FAD-dependent oxidoreductase, partial [Acidobacteriota bacterium]
MDFKLFEFKLPTDFTAAELKRKIEKKLKTTEFSYSIDKQSLDARDKGRIFWLLRVGVSSPALPGAERKTGHELEIPFRKREKRVVVVGSGPAGFFCADTLVRAGFKVTIFEQGSRVPQRSRQVTAFEKSGEIDERNNYAFGEGGAGTFSDGKLTSRTKSISKEREFIIRSYINAGAPEEIAYLAFPHIGSDNLVKIVKNLGEAYLLRGGRLIFDARVTDIHLKNGNIHAVETDKGRVEADHFVFAGGHSDYGTFRMLIKKGIPFQVKPFAIGCRVEHPQEIINFAQWGRKRLPGVKAAEYRLTWKETGQPAIYSFCMCPGGQVV